MIALCLANTVWGVWATRAILALEGRQIVSVSLTGLVSDFIAAESRRADSPEQAAARVRAYLASLDRAVAALERDGAVVLVRESVLGQGVPDRTAQVRRTVEQEVIRAPR
ncbi:TrbI F-type domain-containing protein [Sphingomonas sp. ID1715]|uniref:TrbI F-type domain-containing protein n=1 Tax=Sphingomonas sp. ID1715 TaxID=1656898 RepID=UPI0014876938|nr:TrbI F-type domain-containing protein [Sphingomonas sp. ID1715]NNM78019.1 TrbI F-type domain-containing protein [Sphingomonas sp. ID1715]